MTRTDQELQAFAEQHLAHEVRMFIELPKLRAQTPAGLLNGATYESWLVHARNLDTFIRSLGEQVAQGHKKPEARADDFVDGWRPTRVTAVWRDVVNAQVAHLRWDRRTPGTDGAPAPLIDVDEVTVVAEIGSDLFDFYQDLPDVRQPWFAFIPRHFPVEAAS